MGSDLSSIQHTVLMEDHNTHPHHNVRVFTPLDWNGVVAERTDWHSDILQRKVERN